MSVYKRGKEGTHWHYRFRVRGVRYRGAIPEARTKKEAEQAESKIKQDVFEGKFGKRDTGTMKLSTFIDEIYMPWAKSNKTSWLNDHYIAVSLKNYFGDKKLKEGLAGAPTYYLRSTVLNGAVIAEIDSSGQKKVGYVYTAEGEVLAKQVPLGSSSYVVWKNSTPAGTGQYDWIAGGAYGTGMLQRVELDPMGADVGIDAPQTSDLGGAEGDVGSDYFAPMMDSRFSNFFDLRGGCTGTVLASCQSPLSPNEHAQTSARALLGDRWYDLPGNDNVVERTARLYVRDVQRIFAEVTAAKAAKAKPKPTLRTMSAEEKARRKVFVAEFGRSGWGDEGDPLEGSLANAFPQNPMKDGGIGTPCSDALKLGNGTIQGVNRAHANRQDLMDVAAQYGNIIDWKILAAIGICESDFQNVAELGGGPGRGVFQISTGAPASITGNIKASANYVMQNRLVPQYNKYLGTYGAELALRGALRDYNHSDATTPNLLDSALRRGYFEELDSDTAPYRASGKIVPGNYVTNVLNIAKCLWD